MAFGQNNNFNNNQNGEKKRTNFPLNKFWGTNGRLELAMWLADGGAITTFTIKQEVGKDPSTNASVLENKGSQVLSMLLRKTLVRATSQSHVIRAMIRVSSPST